MVFQYYNTDRFYADGASTREEASAQLQAILSQLQNGTNVADGSRPIGFRTIRFVQWPMMRHYVTQKNKF